MSADGGDLCPHNPPKCPRLEACDARSRDVNEMRDLKDGAYLERNQVVALAGKLLLHLGSPVGLKKTPIEGWSPEWHNCVYMELPTGQISWHFHDDDAPLFEGFPEWEAEWDGHTTDEKYERIKALGLPAACRVCGCTEDRGCTFGCYWVEPDLCSQCVRSTGGKPA